MRALAACLKVRAEERDRREAWEVYTANALWSMATAWGGKFAMYSDIINGTAGNEKTGAEIADGLLAQMGGYQDGDTV